MTKLDRGRIALVLSGSASGWGVQTGYLVTANMVLTARHGITEQTKIVWLDKTTSETDVAWKSPDQDAVLLQLRGVARPKMDPVQWGTFRDEKAAWTGVAFADAGKVDANGKVDRDSVGLSGHVEPGGGLARDRYELVVEGEPISAESWRGASGGPVIVQGHLVGIVCSAQHVFEGRRLLATPVSRLLEDAEFRRATGEPSLKQLVFSEAGAWTAPQQTPPLSSRYVPRPAAEEWLRGRLDRRSGTLERIALVGLGGSGKSTLAQAIACSPVVLERFRDGVLWARLGLRPNTLSLLDGWIQALGERGFRATDPQTAAAQLRTLLANKECLLVVDDAWTDEAALFAAGGDRCTILFTTRKSDLARWLKVSPEDVLEIGPMEPAAAITLLVSGVNREPSPGDTATIAALAKEFGYLAQALDILAGRAQDGTSWTSLLEEARVHVGLLRAVDDLDADEDDLEARARRSVTASLLLSLVGGPRQRCERFAWLGVLAEDAAFGIPTAAILWGMDRQAAARELTLLRRANLLSTQGENSTGPMYGLHDTVRDLAVEILTSKADEPRFGVIGGGLGRSIEEGHGHLLDRYREAAAGRYSEIADDGYIHDHLIEHLLAANRFDHIDVLFREANETGENAWFAARMRSGALAGFISDVHAVLAHLIGRESALAAAPDSISAPLLRYLLILASQRLHLPPALLARLVREDRWRLASAEQYIEEQAEGLNRAGFYMALAKLPGEDRVRLSDLALKAVQRGLELKKPEALSATEQGQLTKVVTGLAELGFGDEIVSLAPRLAGVVDELPLLVAAIPSLPPERVQAVVERCIDLAVETGRHFRASQWEVIGPHLSLAQTVRAIAREQARSAGPPENHPYFGGQCLGPLLVRLAQCGEWKRALERAHALDEITSRTQVLAELAAHVPGDDRTALVMEVQALVRSTSDDVWLGTVRAAIEFLGELGSSLYMMAVKMQPGWGEGVLRSLAPAMDGEQAASWLAELADHAPLDMAAAAVELLGPKVDANLRDEVSTKVWVRCSAEPPASLIGPLRSLLRAGARPEHREAIVAALIAVMDSAQFGEIADSVLTAMPEESTKVLDLIANGRADERLERLSLIADKLPSGDLDRAVEIARVSDDESARLLARAAIAAELRDAAAIARVLDEVDRAAEAEKFEYERSEVLARLAPALPEELLQRAMRAFGEIKWVTAAAERAAPALFRRTKDSKILDRALEAIEAADDTSRAGTALAAVWPLLSVDQRERARSWLLTPRAGSEGAQEIVWMIEPILSLCADTDLAHAFVDAVMVLPEDDHLPSLRWSLAYIPSPERERAQKLFDHLASRSDVVLALCAELQASKSTTPARLIDRLVALLADLISNPEAGGRHQLELVMARAMPFFPQLELALDATLDINEASLRGQALEGLAPRLDSRPLIDKAIEAARVIEHAEPRARALRALAGRLALQSQAAALPVLREAFRAALQGKEAPWLDEVTPACARGLVEQGTQGIRDGCHDLIASMIQFGRSHVLGKFSCSAPLLAAGFSREGLRDGFDAIGDVGEFWP